MGEVFLPHPVLYNVFLVLQAQSNLSETCNMDARNTECKCFLRSITSWTAITYWTNSRVSVVRTANSSS
jgi:hypothetical protein